MSLTVQQLLTDAKRLSTRLRDHDQTADSLITRYIISNLSFPFPFSKIPRKYLHLD